MLDSRPGLCTVFVDCTPAPDVVTRYPYPCHPTPLFPPTFPPRQDRHLAADNPRNHQHRGPSGLPALPTAVAVSHHPRDVIMSRPGSHVVTLPPLPHAAATHSPNEKQRFRHRFSARVAFPQFLSACYNGTANTVGSYHLGQSHHDIKTNLTCEIETTARTPKVQTLDRFVGRQHHPSSSDLLKQSLFRSHFQGGLHDERWWKPMLGAGDGRHCLAPPGTWWKAEAEAQCWQDKGNRSTASAEDCLLGTSRKSGERAEITAHAMDSLTMSPSRILPSAPVTAAHNDSTTQHRPKTQEDAAADRRECCPRTSSEDANPQPLKQELTHSREVRHCRSRRVKDSSNKLHPVMSSLISKRHKNQNRKMPEQQQQHDADSDSILSQQQQESEPRKTFRCLQCRYMTDRKNNLKRHVVTMHHKATRLLECCATIFHSKASLREHVSRYHRGGYRCQVCSRNFCRKALLRRHLAVHSGQKDFACQLCGYATSHKSNLERHQRVHSRKTSSLGGPRLSSHPLGEDREEPATESSARFTGGRIPDYGDDVCSSNMSSGQASPSSFHNYTDMPLAEMESLKHQMSPQFSENQPCCLMFSATALQQKHDTVSRSSSIFISADGSHRFKDSSNSGAATSSNLDLVSSRTTEAADSQFMEDSRRLDRDDTNLSKDTTNFLTDSVHIQDCCCSPKTDPAPSLNSDSPDTDEGQFATRRTFSCRRFSRHRVLSRKGCFPNRLNETYQPPVHKHDSKILATDGSSHQTDRKHDGDNDDTSENLKENEIPSQHAQMLSKKSPSLVSETTTNGATQTCGSDRALEEKTIDQPQNKHRLCSRLLYRCSSCRACFLHQGELCGHVCRHPQAGYIFRFPLTSSVKKGCIPRSGAETDM